MTNPTITRPTFEVDKMAHHNAPEHLTEKFYDECCRMGARAYGWGREA